MVYRIEWSPHAVTALERKVKELQANSNSEQLLNSYLTEIECLLNRILLYPYARKMNAEYNVKSIRESFVGIDRLIYKIEGEAVRILTLIEAKNPFQSILDELRSQDTIEKWLHDSERPRSGKTD